MSDKISFIDLSSPEQQALFGHTLDEIGKLAKRGEFILGSAVKEFEAKFADWAGCRYGVGVNSGLDALILALRVLGVGEGDEVITAPNSFVASAAAIALVGARPVFADVDWDYNLNPALVEKAITPKTKAIMPVHLTGNPCRMDQLTEIARKHRLAIVEDAAQAIGATFQGQRVGSFSDVAAFSLHPLKNLHIWGDGGMMTTQNEGLAEALKLQRNHGLKNRDEVEFFSYNSRLDTVQALVGLDQLTLLESTTKKRKRNAAIYYEKLAPLTGTITLPPIAPEAESVFHVFQIRAQRRDELKAYLEANGIETKIHYPIPIHWQKPAAALGYRRGDFPVTDTLAGEILSLPVRESLTEDQVHRVVEKVTQFCKR